MIQRRVQRLTTILGLTDDQASQATTIFTNAHTAAAPLQTSILDARKSMRTAVKANDTSTISTAAANIGNLTGQMLAIHSKAEAAFYAILTPEQQAKLDQLGGAGFGPGGMGGGMGMGMGGMQGPMGGRPGPR